MFHRAAECDSAARDPLLEAACVRDLELRREVEALLSFDCGAGESVMAAVNSELDAVGFPLTGETISHYRILEGLGGGGMGLVYRAEDLRLGRQVALKFLPEESVKNPGCLGRFEREARSASALEHPNICPIYEFGEHEGQPFLAMQLLEGQTLRERIGGAKSGTPPFQLADLLDLAIQIVEGLDAAHRYGIIHRDIKPANIFVTSQGQARILDFGLAKLAQGDASAPDDLELSPHDNGAGGESSESAHLATPDRFLSRTGVAMGTAGYMSPEQVRGEKLDARTDLFSFGLVLYEMATGKRAFEGATGPVLQEAILKQLPTRAREANPDVPARLETIINKALEKDRAARYQTASCMRAELEDLQRQLAPKHLPRVWAVGLGIAAAIAVAVILFFLNRPPKTVSVAPEIKLRQLTVNSSENPVGNGAISPDGKYLAYVDTRGLHLKFIDTGETRTVPKPEAFKDQSVKWEGGTWFPDSTRFLANIHPSTEDGSSVTSSIWVVSVLGGAPTKLRDHAIGCAVSHDGSTISFVTNKGKSGERQLWFMGPHGEQARKFYEAKEGTATDCWGWSPDGKHYIYVSRDESGDTGLSQSVESRLPITLFGPSEMSKINDFVWLHDGRLVYSLPEPTNGNVCNYWTMRLDLDTGRRLEVPRRLTNWPSFCVSSGSASNDNKRLAFAAWSGFFTSYVADLEARGTRLRNVRHFTLEDTDDGVRGWTAGGNVLFTQNGGNGWSLYRQSLDSDTPEPIVSSGIEGALLLGATSPDGKWYIGRIWPNGESIEHPTIPFPILRIPLAGGAPETILQLSRAGNVSCARPPSDTCVLARQSEDHKQIVVAIFDPVKGQGPELARFDLDRELAAIEVPICVISPDGTRLALSRSPESPIEIRSLNGQLMHKIPSQSVGELIWLFWSADQKGFFVTRNGQRGNELLYLDLHGKATSLRKCIGGETCFGLPSPDGRHLAIIDRNQSTNMWMMENF